MKLCPGCNAYIKSPGDYCPYCGGALSAKVSCRSCGEPLAADHAFCSACGAKAGRSSGAKPTPLARQPSQQPVAAAPGRKLSRWWPESVCGNLLYLAAIAGGGYFGYSLCRQDPQMVDTEWMMVGIAAGITLIVLTIWRLLLISGGALSARQVIVDQHGNQKATGGLSGWGTVFVVLGVALSVYSSNQTKKDLQQRAVNRAIQQSLQRNPEVKNRTRTMDRHRAVEDARSRTQ